MGWFAVLICSVLGTAVGLLELAPPGTAAIRRDIAAPPLNLDIAPNVKPSVKLHPAESCVFNGKLYALNELREVPKGIYVCAGKNVWNIKSCAHRGKQIPLMIETRFDNESVVCMQKKLADGTLDFITKRMWPGPAVSAPKPPPAAVPPPVPQPPKKPCPTKVTQAAPTPATPPKLKAEPGKAVTAPPAVPQPPKKPCPTKVTQAAPAPTAPPTLKAEPGKAVTAPPAVPQPPKKPCPTKAQQATVPTVKPVPRPFPLPIVGDYTLPPMKNIPTPPADTKGLTTQSSQTVSPSVDYTNCGSIADFRSRRKDKCFQKYLADPAGTCAKYPGSSLNEYEIGSYTGAICDCEPRSQYSASGYNCTKKCTPADRGMCEGNLQQCYYDEKGKPGCICIKGYKLEQGKCIRQANYCQTCEFNCHMSQTCQDSNDREQGAGYTCSACDEELGFKTSSSGGDSFWCNNINECIEGKHKCDDNALCVDKDPSLHNGTKYICQCKTGWQGIGTVCNKCTDVNECLIPNICGKNSECTNTQGSYTCKCEPGYKPGGSTFSEQGHQDCIDINECVEYPQACKAFSTCNNTDGSYECPCNPGYVGEGKTRGCKLDDSICATCDKKTTKCGVNAAQTAYECQCVANHTSIAGNSTHCKPVTYCDKGAAAIRCAPSPKSTCTDNPDGSGYTCKCNKGYVDEGTGDSAGKGYVCYSEDPCERYSPCALVAHALCNRTNDKKGYRCDCRDGYIRQLEGQGNDSAPCYEVTGPQVNNCTQCRTNSEICTPVKGDAHGKLMQCSCAPGYKRPEGGEEGNKDYGECINVNECRDAGLHDCDTIRALCNDKYPTKENNMTKFTCECMAGYKGTGKLNDCHNINECTETPGICGETKTCHDRTPGYDCVCAPGFTERKSDPNICEDINECALGLATCNAYATCVNTYGSYNCTCDIEKNFKVNGTNEKGVTCGIIDVCKEGLQGKGVKACPDPNHICTQDGNRFQCSCPKGFASNGQICEGIDECRDEQKNDCDAESTTCVDRTPGYDCICKQPGYEAIPNNTKRCQDVNECNKPKPCNPDTTCINTKGSYRCVCNDGFEIAPGGTVNMPYCKPKNPCASSINPCYGGDCIYDPTKPPFYVCKCNYGLMVHNGTTCIDSKYCDKSNHYKCPPFSKCVGRMCVCDDGYQWTTVQMPLSLSTFSKRACAPINWCTQWGQKNCRQKGYKCRNLEKPGEGECYCDDGFRMGPDGCGNINECIESQAAGKSLCPAHSECMDTPGSYKCICSDGYYLIPEKSPNETHPYCVDLDECEFEQHNCSSYKNTKCKNLDGGFECICKPGFKPEQIGGDDFGRQSNRDCEWQDPCENDPCEENAVCDSSSGCVVCKCPPGYHGTGTKERPCLDDEECLIGRNNCTLQTENCVELKGSFRCDCKPGFAKNSKGVCEDINECKKTPTICVSQKNSFCNNTIGSYLCVCKEGFIYDEKTKTCIDFKECSQPGICGPSPGNTCKEQEGTYECICDTGYSRPCNKGHKQCPCHNINECDNATACDKNAFCTDTPGSYICICKPGYKGSSDEAKKPGGCKYIPICDRNKCELPNTHCEPKNDESFECVCDTGYIRQRSNGVCVKNPCPELKCEGGDCVPREVSGKVAPICVCKNTGEIYNNKTGKCVPSDVCKCPNGQISCKNSTVCPDPPRQLCTPNGAEPYCQCESWLQPNPKTKKCENCDSCIGRCPPGAVREILINSLGDNYDRDCKCPKGYEWQRDYQKPYEPGKCVVDVDCSLEAFCNNKPGTICDHKTGTCICDSSKDFAANVNGSCIKIDACVRDRQQGKDTCKGPGTIPDGRGEYCECNCQPGYKKDCKDGITTCVDIPECSERPHPCYNRTDKPYCIEKPGSYECTCNGTLETQGYVINENGECAPPDLCKTRAPCPVHSTCIPADGSCVCNPGFADHGVVTEAKKDPDCKNIDECLSENTYICPENARCNDTIGSYECICVQGYEKVNVTTWIAKTRNLEKTFDFECRDIDECKTKKNACANDTRIECVNYPGDYNCTCKFGLQQYNSKECVEGNKVAKENMCTNCSQHSTCAVIVGNTEARNCTCITDYEGSGVGKDGCKPIQYCGRKPRVCVDIATCEDKNPGYNCVCPEGYEGDGKSRGVGCTLINFCAKQNPCPKDANCTSIGAKPQWTVDRIPAKAWTTCKCRDGYEFDRETFTCKDVDECAIKKKIIDDDHTPCPKIANCTNTQGSFTCICPQGRDYNTLMNSCDDIDECKTGQADSCKPATGDCQNTDGSWVCNCKPGYEHKDDNDKICEYVDRCNTTANPCNSTTSICHDAFSSGFRCECKKGYQESPNDPLRCVDINECTFPNDCNYLTQTCENTDGSYKCHCRVGYVENNGVCEPTAPCTKPCKDYSICVMNRGNTNSSCKCIDHYKWLPEKKTCSIVACKDSDCGEGGKCVVVQNRNDSLQYAQLPYRCVCGPGYSLDPVKHLCKRGDVYTCEKDKSCGIGTCVAASNKNGFTCSCPGGECFPSCDKTQCDSKAECRTATRDGKVVMTYCQCKEGYRGFGTITTGCFPIQDCDERLCSKYAACKLVDGKSTCVCDPLYTGNGTYCVDRDECTDGSNNCDDLATCTNIQGGFTCACKKGYTGTGTKGNCKDINECDPSLVRLSKCNATTTTCNNTEGDYECICRDGYRNTTYPFFQCPDINECLEGNHTCGKHQCVNEVPWFQCICGAGYEQVDNKKSCRDIDECIKRTHDCNIHAICTNTDGGFNCTCKEGYTGNGKTCEIIDKCQDPKDNRCRPDTTTCTMQTGKTNYWCKCHDGYKPPAGQSEWSYCDDIDECLNETLYDSTSTACTNTNGSYNLNCRPGYINVHPNTTEQNVSCVPRDECSEDPAWLENAALLKAGTVNVIEWRTWMVKPKNPDSGYAFCYNEAIKNRRFGDGAFLPNCKNLAPNETMVPMNTARTPPFAAPRGFTCACPNGQFEGNEGAGGLYTVSCQNFACNCNEGFKCKGGDCICLDPSHKMRTVKKVAKCLTVECDTDYTVPDNLVRNRDKIACNNSVFVAARGYRLVRHEVTDEVIDVVDINECTEGPHDPCCINREACTGDYCMQCINTEGDYTCAYRSGNTSTFCNSADPNTCRCNEPTCGRSLSWYYSCESECNATLDKRLDDPKYNRELCSRVFDEATIQFVTFPSLKNLYQYICSLTNENQNKYGCLFDKSGADLTTSPLFNYWGQCTKDLSAVTCEGGTKAKMGDIYWSDVPTCPSRYTPIPRDPAIGQPIGQQWSRTPWCMMTDNVESYKTGDFYVKKGDNDGAMILTY